MAKLLALTIMAYSTLVGAVGARPFRGLCIFGRHSLGRECGRKNSLLRHGLLRLHEPWKLGSTREVSLGQPLLCVIILNLLTRIPA